VTVKAAPYAFFVAALRFGTNSLITNQDLVTKIYLPRLVFPLAAVLSQLFDLMVAGVVITVFLVIAGAGVSLQLLWLPLIMGTLILLSSALAILFSAATLSFRDVRFIVEALLTFAIFFTPVFYEPAMFGRWAPLLLVNPVSPLLDAMSAVVIHHQMPSLPWLGYSVAFSVALFVFAVVRFKQLEPFFAERI
jgi:homopolymeric O-antigen transport system permease protein